MGDMKFNDTDLGRVTLSIEPVLIGPYELLFRATSYADGDMTTVTFRVQASDVIGAMGLAMSAVRVVEDRRVFDAAVGNCDRCRNTRMVTRPGPGGTPRQEHCPYCYERGRAAVEATTGPVA